MNWPFGDTALLREQLKAAEVRATAAEAALVLERRDNRQQERHWASMFLRREKSLPLPPTSAEKVEAKIQAEEAAKRPPELDDVLLAKRNANRVHAAGFGYSQEEADEMFMKNIHMFADE